MRIGIFGGTFDPPHLAHLILADEARARLSLESVLWVLTPVPPHKPGQPITPLAHRLDMLAATISDNPAFVLCRVDVDRPPPYYAVDTMRLLRKLYPNATLVYLMGGDSLRDLPAWRASLEFLAACDGLGVMRRPADQIDLPALERDLPGLSAKVHFIEVPPIDISAREIRRRIAAALPYRYFLPQGVYQIIRERALYQSSIY